MAKYYLTTTLPYVNAEPHIGFALEIVQADVLARYHRSIGDDVIFNFGTDEHGQKIWQKALSENKEPQAYVNEYAAKFDNLKKALNLSYDHFIRTTDPNHIEATKKFWELCQSSDDIYKKNYKTKYCVGCELEKTDSDLVEGKCPLHPSIELEIIEEENYFFRFSKYQKPLLDLYQAHSDFVVPNYRFNEIKQFVKEGLKDFSISRLKSKMPWGIEVPDDPDHVMYVWFDALINYISTLGWPNQNTDYHDFWPGYQVAGKDNLRQQSAIWQAMLLSAGLPPSKQIFIHGFISINNQKISKSLGNSISPYALVEKYGVDTVRYFLLSKIHPWEDSDFSIEKFESAYTNDLANGLGNLVSRVAALAKNHEFNLPKPSHFSDQINTCLNNYEFHNAINFIWSKISDTDKLINQEKPWDQSVNNQKQLLETYITSIKQIAYDLNPFLPFTAKLIQDLFSNSKVQLNKPLFPRLK